MDSRLKGIILNHTLKSYKITPIESANVLRVTMKFYGGFKYKSPSKRRRDKLRKEKFLAKFRRDPILVPSPSWSLANPLPLLPWVDQFLKTWHCLCYWDKEGGGWNQETASEVYHLPRRQRMLKSKGTECAIGYWTWRTRSMMCKRKYGSWNKIWMVNKRSWHS